jgi:hypothetical protein
VPFHLVRSMILVDGKVNRKAATFLLDTGSNNTIITLQAAGVDLGKLRALLAPFRKHYLG